MNKKGVSGPQTSLWTPTNTYGEGVTLSKVLCESWEGHTYLRCGSLLLEVILASIGFQLTKSN